MQISVEKLIENWHLLCLLRVVLWWGKFASLKGARSQCETFIQKLCAVKSSEINRIQKCYRNLNISSQIMQRRKALTVAVDTVLWERYYVCQLRACALNAGTFCGIINFMLQADIWVNFMNHKFSKMLVISENQYLGNCEWIVRLDKLNEKSNDSHYYVT